MHTASSLDRSVANVRVSAITCVAAHGRRLGLAAKSPFENDEGLFAVDAIFPRMPFFRIAKSTISPR